MSATASTPIPNHEPHLTLAQLLKSPIARAPPMEYLDDCTDKQEPTPHTSSKNNINYVPVDYRCLQMLSNRKVQKFCDYIDALSSFVTFRDSMKQPFSASTISNEGDVNAFLESQVVIPAWEAVTRMFPPSERDYDLMSRRQFYTEEGIPDIVFGSKTVADDGSGRHVYTPRAILEFKRPGIVEGLLPVFVNLLRNRNIKSDLPSGWVTVMQQLRKYAITADCSHILVMDERVGIYFEFVDASDDDEDINFLLSVHPDVITPENEFIAPDRFTLRQLLAFMCYRAFGTVFPLRPIPTESTATVTVSSSSYSDSLPPDVGPRHSKRTHKNTPSRQQPSRSSKSTRVLPTSDTEAPFTGWIAGARMTLRLRTEDTVRAPTVSATPPTTRARANSRPDSGFHEAISPPRLKHDAPPRPYSPLGGPSATFTITRVYTRAAALLTTDEGKTYIAKLFSPLHTRIAHSLLQNEVAAYAAAKPLQGHDVPYYYGTWDIPGAAHLGVLLVEYIAPGITIAALKHAGEYDRVRGLWGSAKKAVERLHSMGVRHGDLVARNLMVDCCEGGGQKVVIVDFDCAKVEGPEGVRRHWADWVFLKEAFKLPGVESE